MLNILNTYKIKLPFLQREGKVATNLKISVGLRTIDVKAKGDFFTKKANFDYLGLNIDIFDTFIELDNYDVLINEMSAKYKDIASTKVKVVYDAKTSIGKIKFKVKDVSFKEQDLSLATNDLDVTYSIVPNNDTISVAKSKWKFHNEAIDVGSLKIPFNLNKLIAKVPPTIVEIHNTAKLYASGEVHVKTLKSDIDIDFLSLSYKGANLGQSNAQAKLLYDESIQLDFKNRLQINHNKLDYALDKLSIDIVNKKIKIKSSVKVDNIAQTKAAFTYSLSKKSGTLSLQDTKITDSDKGILFSKKSRTYFTINNRENLFIIESKAIDTIIVIDDTNWFLNIDSIAKVAKYSDILKLAKINNGDINVYNTYNDDINFNSSFKYPHKLLVLNNKPISKYHMYGTYDVGKNSSSVHINNLVHIDIDKNIKVSTKNIGIDIDELVNALDNNNSKQTSNKSINLTLNAKHCYLYISKDRHVVSDTIDVQYVNNILTAQLIYKKGSAGFKFHNKKFHLYGEGFNDIFMDKLFALSKFDGGTLDFSMQGTTKKFDGILNVKDTTILEYKILNNILAFVNTIPSLVTFSLPDYNKHGLKVKEAYVHFTSKDDVFDISDINLDSKELDILGRGTASYKHNNIDLELNLKTDLGSSASQLPVVGYILFDKDSMSTSMSITGKLTNPKVKSLIAQEIIVNPLNIIKRTLLLPYHLLSDLNMSNDDEVLNITE